MDKLKQARLSLKYEMQRMWPGRRCACGRLGATDLGHIVYTRHPDSEDLYHPLNMVLLHNQCNCNEERWINVNACLICLQRAGGPDNWLEWAWSIERRGGFWVPEKMRMAMELWEMSVKPFDLAEVKFYCDFVLS